MNNIEILLSELKPFIGVLLFVVLLIVLVLLILHVQYQNSRYGAVSGNSFWKTIFNKGNYGEFLTFRILEKLKGNNKLLTNVYVPKADGTTAEIDLLMINRAGFYVFESKNYSGWIFGDEKSKNWTTSLKGGRKIQFLSPVIQNNGHIHALRKLLGEKNSNIFYSFIVFSKRCELKKVSITSTDIFVLKRDMLYFALKKDLSKRAEILTDVQITDFYEIMQKYSLADAETKEKHIQNIQNKQKDKPASDASPIIMKGPAICEPTQTQDILLVEETDSSEEIQGKTNIEETPIYKNLKQYRFDTSKTEGIQAYNVYNNSQLRDVIAAMPMTLEDLKKISGFGDVKCQKYGDAILEIVRRNS